MFSRGRAARAGAALLAAAAIGVASCEGALDGLSGGPAAAKDGGVDADMPIVQPCPTGAFCDDFESGGTGKWLRVDPGPLGTIVVDDRDPRVGENALHVTVAAGDGGVTYAEMDHPLAAVKASGIVGLRFWMLVHETLPDETAFAVLRPQTGSFPSIALESTGGKLTYFIADSTDTGSGNSGPITAPLGVDDYVCVSLTVTVGKKGHILATVGGKTAIDVDDDTLSDGAGYGAVGIGLPTLPTVRRTDIFFDDVAIADFPLPCP